MKRSIFKSRSFVAFAAIAMTTFTSCNRGVGCPTNFSVNELLQDCVSVVINMI